MEIVLDPLEINIVSTGGSVVDGIKFFEQIKEAEKQGRQVIVRIDISGATAAKWRKK